MYAGQEWACQARGLVIGYTVFHEFLFVCVVDTDTLLLCQGTVDALFFSFPVTCTRVRSSFLGEKCFRQIP